MKGLTVMQPHAELIASGLKGIETRSWPTKYRGPLAIHAGLRVDREASRRLNMHDLVRGAVVATVNLEDVRRMRPTDETAACTPYVEGRYAWILTDHRRLDPPVPRVGAQGLWTMPDAVA